ncbi:MAG: ribonuclease P protein component [Alphaproteobacteria bacterium]|nr:ribonuclease P protein component [Alphaproteobacteria bacterium]
MEKKFRIRKRRDFLSASASGLSYRADFFVALAGFNKVENYRVGFTASKKVGNAVIRNRCKRRMRAMARQLLPSLGFVGVDYVFIAKKSLVTANWNDFVEQAEKAIQNLNKKIEKCKKY